MRSMGLRAVFLISVLLAGAVRAGNSWDNLADIDYCDYTGNNVRCGDQCIRLRDDCQCGNETIQPFYTYQHCCLPPGGSCTTEPGGRNRWGQLTTVAVCNEGRTLSMSSRCENTLYSTCHNAYQDSWYIGPLYHFSCPHTCVLWYEMCQGLDWCPEELNRCGDPELRCPYYDGRVTKHNITTSAGSAHYYCTNSKKMNNKKYDSIDRDDERQLETEGSVLDIDISLFAPCNVSYYNTPGLMCATAVPESDCRGSDRWCDEADAAQCNTTSGMISTTDARLCFNPDLWRNVSCSKYFSDGRVWGYGSRCTSYMVCTYPWYTQYRGIGKNPNCNDRSDEIFEKGLTCRQHLQKHIDFHQEKFCNINYPEVLNEPICYYNKTQWLSEYPSRSDPHNCQSSCANSSVGLDCIACSNSSYFPCFKSGHCIPPELVCDGHPQCPNGEDENLDLDNCHQKYIENNIVEPYASYRCNSAFYTGMEIYSTPCNDKTECADRSGRSL